MAMKTFYVGVKGVITDGDKVLMVRDERSGEGMWDVPGGRIDDDEDILQTLDRELHEELPNIQQYEVGRLLDTYRLHKDIAEGISLVLLFYEIKNATFEGTPQLSEEHTAVSWISVSEMAGQVKPYLQSVAQKL